MSRTLYIAILVSILAGALISANTGGLYIYALDEAKNSVCAREMMERGDMIVPTFNYQLRGDKPPLHYYFMMAAYRMFGVSEFSARFFSVVMGVLTVLTVFLFTNRFINRNAALFAALALISSLHFVLQFHMAVPDPYLIFFLTLGWVFFYRSAQSPSWKNTMIMYASFALATLAKGPVALALPGISILIYLILTGNFSKKGIGSLKPLPGLLLFLIITLPWFILVHLSTHGEWTRIFFLEHNLDRYTSTMEGHGAFFLVTPLMVLLGMLPFSVFTIQSFGAGWKNRKENSLLLFCIIVSLTIIAFFSFSKTKLPNYTVPAYPFLAVLAGWYTDRLLSGNFKRPFIRLSLWIYLAVVISIPIIIYILLVKDPLFQDLKKLSLYFSILPLAGITALAFVYKKKPLPALLALSVSWIAVTFLFFYILYPQIDRRNPVARSLPRIDKTRPVAVYGLYNPAFSFYIRKPFTPLSDTTELANYVSAHPGAYIISRKRRLEELRETGKLRLIAEDRDIFEIPTTVILEVE